MSLFARSSKLNAHTLTRLAQLQLRHQQPSPLRASPATHSFARHFHNTNANMTVTKITSNKDFKDLIASTVPGAAAAASGEKAKSVVIIDAFAEWCGPCKMIAPEVEKLSEQYGDKAHFVQIDVDELPDIAQELGIRAMPTFKVFTNGEPSGELIGAVPAKLKALVADSVKNV